MTNSTLRAMGSWSPGIRSPEAGEDALRRGLQDLSSPLQLIDLDGELAWGPEGGISLGSSSGPDAYPLQGFAPSLLPHQLGSEDFLAEHGAELAFVGGAMANGIASEELVEALAGAGLLAFFGAAGCSLPRVEAAIDRLENSLEGAPWGMNLIHSPGEPELEAATVELYLRRGIRVVSASAYIDLTLPVVHYRVAGIHRDEDGNIVVPNRILAKVSRPEVARRFLSPPPARLLEQLVERGSITAEQAELAAQVPMAGDITAEADSGGHTDNRPLVVLLPELLALRDDLVAKHGYDRSPRVGAAGGISTPASVAAAFSMGAAYVVAGSVLQACVESGSSDVVREMLAQASAADVTMAPAADMFELGVQLQVLSKGTLFPLRARKLYQLYRDHPSLDALSEADRRELEEKIFGRDLDAVWEDCKSYWKDRDSGQIEQADSDPRHKMALVFRSYLGLSSRWANEGAVERRLDFQVWCGPSMGAFNDWASGSFLAQADERRAVGIARNLMAGAAMRARAAVLRVQGVELDAALLRWLPLSDAEIAARYEAWTVAAAVAPVAEAARVDITSSDEGSSGSYEPIAIVGMDCMFPKAPDLTGFWHLLRTGLDAVGEVPDSHWSPDDYWDEDPSATDRTYARRGAFLDPHAFDPTEFGIPPNIIEATDTSQLLGLVVAQRALADAGCPADGDWDRSKTSVILGVTGTQELVISLGARLGHPHWWRALQEAGVAEDQARDVVERIGRSYVQWQESSFPGLLGNVVAGRIANRFDLGGTNCVTDAACASSLAALHLACMELQTGRAERVLTGGVDALNDIFMHMCFSKTPALSATGDVRPFSAQADGTILGEGVGMVVLRRLADAERDGDRIYAVVRGLGTSSDGRAKSIYAPLPAGQARALRDAYEVSGVAPSTIELLEAHGTGTKAGDVCEFEALDTVYREDEAEGTWCALGSVKSQIGHTKAAAGAAGLIKAVLALHHKVLPPSIKIEAPNPKLPLAASPFYLSTRARPWAGRPDHPRRAAVSSFGFGGSDFHVVVEEYRKQRVAPAWGGGVQLVPLCGETTEAILEGLAALEVGDLQRACAAARSSFTASASRRLVLVISDPEALDETLARVRTQLASNPDTDWTLPGGIHYGVGARSGRLAFLFPGQGSQYVGMHADLSVVFPELLDSLALDPELSGLVQPPPTFDDEERDAQQRRLTATDRAQPALGLVESGVLEILERFGLRPELAAGHSYGELVALHAAGRLSREELIRISGERGRLMAGDGSDRGTMLVVFAPLADIETLVAEEQLEVVLANRNSPEQGVLSGSREAIAAAKAACEGRNWRCRSLDVAAAFHSPLVAGVRDDFAKVLAELDFPRGAFDVYANATASPYPSSSTETADLLAGQLATSVHWLETLEAMYEAGARTFVEVGPGRALTGMVGRSLGDRAHRALALDSSLGRKDGLRDLADILAALAASGHELQLTAWQDFPLPAARAQRMSVTITGANHRAAQPRPQAPVEPPLNLPPMTARAPHPETPMSSNENDKPAAPPADARAAAAALQTAQQSLAALQQMQEQTARIHEQFLQGQLAAQQSFQSLLQGQQALVQQALGGPAVSLPTLPTLPSVPAPQPPVSAPVVVPPQPLPVAAPATAQPMTPPPVPAPVPAAAPAAAPTPAPQPSGPGALEVLLNVVADCTGYPVEMLDLDMDMESDLGIDSIKRVEILSTFSERVPEAPSVEPEQLSKLQTLRQVAEFIGGDDAAAPVPASVPAVPAAAAPSAGPAALVLEDILPALLEVVSACTGYPTEMLDLDMDMESDLGIDSIKRVEILSAFTERVPEAPSVEPEQLSKLQTLRQVAEFVIGSGDASASVELADESPVTQDPELPEPESSSDEATEIGRWRVRPQSVGSWPEPAGDRGTGKITWVVDDGSDLAKGLAEQLDARLVDRAETNGGLPTGELDVLVLLDGGTSADRVVKDSFALLRALAPRLRERKARICTITTQGGDFGFSAAGPGERPARAGLAGLAKTCSREWPEVSIRVLDVADSVPVEQVVNGIFSEGPAELGLSAEGRVELELVAGPVGPRRPLAEEGFVVVTGGARGVTASCAIELARETERPLLLLGRSPLPEDEPSWLAGAKSEAEIKRALLANAFSDSRPSPRALGEACARVVAKREVRATLSALSDLKVPVLYRPVDVRDTEAVAAALGEAREAFGAPLGLVHGAGVLRDRRIEDKTGEQFDAVYDTKVLGLRSFLSALADDPLQFLAVFTSVSGRFGRRGQADYAAANEALVKLVGAEASSRPSCRIVALDWGPWAGGMVTPGLRREFEREGIGMIPLAGGAEHCVAEVLAEPDGLVEVVLGVGLESTVAESSKRSISIDPETHLYLGDHRLSGKPVVPMAMILEWFASAAKRAARSGEVVAIRDLQLLQGIVLDEGAVGAGVVLIPQEEGGFDVELHDTEGRVRARARVDVGEREEAPGARSLSGLDDYPHSVEEAYARKLFHGERLWAIEDVGGISETELTTALKAAPAPSEWIRGEEGRWVTDPLVIDGCFQSMILWCWENRGAPSLPSRLDRYVQYRDDWPAEGVKARFFVRPDSGANIVSDIDLLDGEGQLVARLEGYSCTVSSSLKTAFGLSDEEGADSSSTAGNGSGTALA